MGDGNLIMLCEYIAKASKLKNLKLIKNKLTDESMEYLFQACSCSKNLTALNMAHNHLTEKSLETINRVTGENGSSLKYITLSFNKINKKAVKGRIEELARKNINVSV